MTIKPKDLKSKKDNIGPNNNVIEVNPVLKEASGKKVVISWGRMNPPTIGHEKLVNKVKELARKAGAKAEIYLSQTQDAKKNPLNYEDKAMITREAFGPIIQKSTAKTIIDVMKHLDNTYDDVTLVVGQDRVQEFETLLNKYNGKEFTFNNINVVSAGERDPDAEGVEGMSASKMREAAAAGNSTSFKSGLPAKLKIHADDVYDMVRAGMKLSESADLDEYVLSIQQRQKRSIVMRRFERKMETARARMKKRIADTQHLLGRARKKAIEIIRRKVAGEKGMEYHNLSPSEKMMIDKRVEQRKKAIGKIAARLLPSVRAAEMQRVALLSRGGQAGTGKQTTTHSPAPKAHINEAFESFLEEGKRYHMAYDKTGKPKYDRRFRAFRHITKNEEVDIDDVELLDIIAEANEIAESITLEDIKVVTTLLEKSEKAGIDFDTVYQIYEEGVIEGRNPFDHVNAFIAEGKRGLWANIHARRKKGLPPKKPGEEGYPKTLDIDEAFEQHLNEGIHDPSIFKAVFLSGGPGSGKSFIVGRTALTALGMKVINSDDAFERALVKAGLRPTPEDIYSEKGQELRGQAKVLTGKLMTHAVDGRLGLVVDGTGKDYDKIVKQAEKLKKIGYEVAMIFVNTNLDTAQARNKARERTLPETQVVKMWSEVQDNLGKFQQFFGNRMFIIDNSEGADYESAVLNVYKKISSWAKTPSTQPAAKAWIASGGKLHEQTLVTPNPRINIVKINPVLPPSDPDDLEDDEAIDTKIDNHTKGVTMRVDKMKRFRAYHEEAGAGFEGTDELVKKYKKSTPNQSVNEAFENLFEAEDTEITMTQMKDFERFVDRMFEKYKIDFEFTKHFGERMNDERNSPKIKLKELADLIKKIYAKHGNPLKNNAGAEMVVKDLQSDLNMPVAIKYDRAKDEIDVVAKTIMRKKNFSTPNEIVKY